jgi:hypothetical protein
MTYRRVGAPTASIVVSEIDSDVTAYDPSAERVAVLNHTASAVWRLCDGKKSIDEVVGLVALEFGVDAGSIRADVEKLVDQLTAEGFLSPASGSSSAPGN